MPKDFTSREQETNNVCNKVLKEDRNVTCREKIVCLAHGDAARAFLWQNCWDDVEQFGKAGTVARTIHFWLIHHEIGCYSDQQFWVVGYKGTLGKFKETT